MANLIAIVFLSYLCLYLSPADITAISLQYQSSGTSSDRSKQKSDNLSYVHILNTWFGAPVEVSRCGSLILIKSHNICLWNIVICPSGIVIEVIIISSISNVAAPSWGDAEEIGLCFIPLRMRFNRLLGNFISRCLNFFIRVFILIAVTHRHDFIALIIINGLSVRLFSAASHSPNFPPFFSLF